MKVIFCAMMFPDAEEAIRKSAKPHPVSGHKFQENLLRGLVENKCDVFVVNAPRLRRYPDYPQILFHKKPFQWASETRGLHVGFVNLFALNYITQAINMFLCLRRLIKQNKTEPCVIVTFNSYIQICAAMLAARFLYPKVVLCDVIGDLHGAYGCAEKPVGLLNKLINVIGNFQDKAAKKFDTFVFVTKYMARALRVEEKPHVVVECFYNHHENSLPEKRTDACGKVIFYAGALRADYGIEHLLRAFKLVEKPDYHLQIAGNGETEDIIRAYAAEDPRIEFLGFITPQEVEKRQREATVLISPRTSGHEYVKYSFPSKTMEGLASGKPYIAHRLPCDPPEYGEYIQYAADETDEALRDKIVEICELPAQERDRIGQGAHEFILREKNPTVMCKRIVDMWDGVIKEREGDNVT